MTVNKRTKKYLIKSKSKTNSHSTSNSKGKKSSKMPSRKSKAKIEKGNESEKNSNSDSSSDSGSEDDEQFNNSGFENIKIDAFDSENEQDDNEDDDEHDDDVFENDSSEEADDEEYDMDLEMSKLKETDPKFYQFLVENDQDLLNFVNQDIESKDEIMDQDSGNEELPDVESENRKSEKVSEQNQKNDKDHIVTFQLVHRWRSSIANTLSMKTCKKLVSAFKTASLFGQEESETVETHYTINDEKVFNMVVLSAIKYTPLVLDEYLFATSSNPENQDENDTENNLKNQKLPSSQKKWKRARAVAKSFLSSLLLIMKKMTSESMTKFVIQTASSTIPYFVCFPRMARVFHKELISLWANSSLEKLSILAFLSIRKIAIYAPNPFLDLTLKSIYLNYISCARTFNHYTKPKIIFMKNCFIEICGISLPATYQFMFVSLRKLAMTLRTASTNKTKEIYRSVYNWAFLATLRVWAGVLKTYNADQDPSLLLKPLIYPLVQLVIGVIRLKPSSKHVPFRFHLIDILIEIQLSSKAFIPVSSYLLELFGTTELTRQAKPSTLKPLDMEMSIRAPAEYLGSKIYQKQIIENAIDALYAFYDATSTCIAFPEIVIPASHQFRRIIKNTSDVPTRKLLGTFVEKIESHAKVIETHRNKITFGPKDIASSTLFLSNIEPETFSFVKYCRARDRVKSRVQEQKQQDAVPAVQEKEIKTKKKQEKKSEKPEFQFEGEEDLVEDWSFSD